MSEDKDIRKKCQQVYGKDRGEKIFGQFQARRDFNQMFGKANGKHRPDLSRQLPDKGEK